MAVNTTDVRSLASMRATRPGLVAELAAARRRPASMLGPTGRLMVIAADHPARGALRAGADPLAMADRADLLARLCLALSRPGVNGVLASADVLDDLLLLGALDDLVVLGSMNRGGIAGTSFEIDDRFTGPDAQHLLDQGFEGGKMLLRIDPADPASAAALERCSRAVTELADRGLVAMVEPFMSCRLDGSPPPNGSVNGSGGAALASVGNELSTEAMLRAASVAAGLGASSAYTWLKLPVTADVAGMERVLAASTLPAVLLGGEVSEDPAAGLARFERVLSLPTAMGLVVGRSLLYPLDGDVAAAVDRVVRLL